MVFTLHRQERAGTDRGRSAGAAEGTPRRDGAGRAGTARRDHPLHRENPAAGAGDERGPGSAAAAGGQAAAGARKAGDPRRPEKADQGRRQAQRLARCDRAGRVRQPGIVPASGDESGRPAGGAAKRAGALPRQSGGGQQRPDRRTGDRRGQSAVPRAVRQHRIPVRERRADDRLFAHPRRQPVAGARRLSDAASARRAGRSAGVGKAAALPAQRPPADRGTGCVVFADCGGVAGAGGGRCRGQAGADRFARTVLRTAGGGAGNRPAFSRQGGFCRELCRPAPTRIAPRRFSSPMPAASMACRIFPQRRWRVCWRNRIARRATRRAKARSSRAPRRW